VNNMFTSFDKDVKRGKIGEDIFKEDFLDFLNIKYIDVTQEQGFQVIDSDFLVKVGKYEVKTNYKDDKHLIIEEYTNINEELGPIKLGWFYTSQADVIAFVSKDSRTIILLPFTEKFKQHYINIRENFKLHLNRISYRNNIKWQSAYRRIPLIAINGFFAIYRKQI